MTNLQGILPPGTSHFNSKSRTVVSGDLRSSPIKNITAKEMIDRDRLSQATKNSLKAEFQLLDKNEDGLVSLEELNDQVEQILTKDSDKQKEKIKQVLLENLKKSEGPIQEAQYEDQFIKQIKIKLKQQFPEVENDYDIDEITAQLKEKRNEAQEAIRQIFENMDKDGDKQVDINEFIDYYVETRQNLEDQKVQTIYQIYNTYERWGQVEKKLNEVRDPRKQQEFRPILKITVVDAQNLADNSRTRVIVKHGAFQEKTKDKSGAEPIWNETIIFVQVDEQQDLVIRLEDTNGRSIAEEKIKLYSFKDYTLVDDDYEIYQQEGIPNKKKPLFNVRINYHYSDVQKYEVMHDQYSQQFGGELNEYKRIKSFLNSLNSPFAFMSSLTSGVIENFNEGEIEDIEYQNKLQGEFLGEKMSDFEQYLEQPAQYYGYSKVPWLSLAQFFIGVQIFLCGVQGYYRADFLTLAAIVITIYYMTLPEAVRAKRFQQATKLIPISLVYDMIYLYLVDTKDHKNESDRDEIDYQMQTVKEVSLYCSYFSFLWKICLYIILYKLTLDFVGIVNTKKTKSGHEKYEKLINLLSYQWDKNDGSFNLHQQLVA